MTDQTWTALCRLVPATPPTTTTTTQGLSALDLELARNLTVLEDLDLLENFEALELMPLLEDDDD